MIFEKDATNLQAEPELRVKKMESEKSINREIRQRGQTDLNTELILQSAPGKSPAL